MNAIQPVRRAELEPVVQFADETLAVEMRFDAGRRTAGSACYALQLSGTRSDVRGRLVGVVKSGAPVELGTLDVALGSSGSSSFQAVPLDGSRFTQVFLEVRADGHLLRLEAPRVPANASSRPLRAAYACMALGAAAVIGASAFWAAGLAPAVAAPAHAYAGEVVRLPYTTTGAGALAYAASYEDGKPLAAGPLTAAGGQIAIMLPPSAVRRHVSVRLVRHGPFGVAHGDAVFAVESRPAAVPAIASARVVALTAHRERWGSADSLLVSYFAVGDRGEVRVSDSSGKAIARVPMSHRGTDRIVVPAAAQSQPLTVQLSVRRGASRVDSSVGVGALPAGTRVLSAPATRIVAAVPVPVRKPESASHVPAPSEPAENTAGSSADIVAVVGRVVAGRPFVVAIGRNAPNMRLRLADETGNVAAEVDVPPTARSMTLTAPDAGGTDYVLSCIFGAGHAQETVVVPVRVWAR